MEDIEHLEFDVTNVGYYLRPRGGALIIGIGGGRDLQSALLFGHRQATGIDVNPIFVELLEGRFRDFAGLAGRKDVTLIADEARSYLSRNPETYSLIQMSLIDTWAGTAAGSFTLSENALYTLEAWQTFLERLAPDGLFTVSRWYDPENVGESGRMLGLGVASLVSSGIDAPRHHLAMAATGNLATLLMSKEPFSRGDLDRLDEVTSELGFQLVLRPGKDPPDGILSSIVAADSLAELEQAVAGHELDLSPPTDENPYFFNMVKLESLAFDRLSSGGGGGGVVQGNMRATLTLLVLILLLLAVAAATILVPLLVARRTATTTTASRVLWRGGIYFSSIGAGYMLVQIALMQTLSTFLGHPTYALGVVLFTMIASTGAGSLLSDYLPLQRRPWIVLAPLLAAAAILVERFLLRHLLRELITSPMGTKITAAILAISPLGLLLGFFFPLGMRLARELGVEDTPWFWALNGIFGVLCSAVAVFLSIYAGISSNFYLGALLYGLLPLSALRLAASVRETPRHPAEEAQTT